MIKNKVLMLTSDPHILDRRIFQQASYLARDGYKVTIAYTSPNLILPKSESDNLSFIFRPIFNTNNKSRSIIWGYWQKLRELGSHSTFLIRFYQYFIAKYRDTAIA